MLKSVIYLLQKENKINIPKQKYIDLFYLNKRIINIQLYKMLKRKINIFPYYFLEPIDKAQKKLDVVFKTHEKYLPLSPRRFKFHYFDKLPYLVILNLILMKFKEVNQSYQRNLE